LISFINLFFHFQEEPEDFLDEATGDQKVPIKEEFKEEGI